MVAKGELLNPGGVVLIHRPKEKEMPDAVLQLERGDQREYGRSIVDFYFNKPWMNIDKKMKCVRMENV